MRGATTTTTTTIDTVNAAATAIVSAESRVQPPSVPKVNKRIGHAVLVPEPEASRVAQPSSTETQIQSHSATVVHPFIAPPSSPASFLQSEPPSVTQSPGGLLSLKSLPADAYSPRGPPSMFAIGPYAHETQLVTPPVFSAFTTEPSTAPFTPPPESVQLTTPSSPEVPFAQLLTSSLERARRNSGGTISKFGFYNYEFPQVYSGSPSGQLISPGSVISNSGTCSPFPDRHPVHEFRTGDATKLIGFEHFNTRKWGSRLGSGTVTPDGVGRGSRFASGTATPDGVGLGSRLGSGTVTPDGVGLGSRLGSGTNTPDGMWVVGPILGSGTATPDGVGLGSRLGSGTATPDGMWVVGGSRLGSGTATPDGGGLYSTLGSGPLPPISVVPENMVTEVAHLPLLGNGARTNETIVDHRVSFELSGEDVARCLQSKSMASNRTFLDHSEENHFDSGEVSLRVGETFNETPGKSSAGAEEEPSYRRQRSVTLGSIKEFNFDSSKGEALDNKPAVSSEWWANETIAGKDSKPAADGWSFFPILQPEFRILVIHFLQTGIYYATADSLAFLAMAMAPTVKVVLGSTAFAIFWVLAVFPAVPFLPIGRTAGSLLGAMLMVIFRVITPDQAYAAIDLPILGLLFGTMVVSVYLERADMFKYLGKLLSYKSQGPKDLLFRICLISALSSAFFTNDTSCVVLTEFVLKVARQHNLPPHPFLLALASSANIGSAATPIGNPQNLVIAVQSKITFGEFVLGILPAMVVGVVVNAIILMCMYWKLLSSAPKDLEDASEEVVDDEDVISHRFSPATMSHHSAQNSQDLSSRLELQGSPPLGVNGHVETLRNRIPSSSIESDIRSGGLSGRHLESGRISNASSDPAAAGGAAADDGTTSQKKEENGCSSPVVVLEERDGDPFDSKWKRILWKSGVYIITIGMLVALLLGLNMSWSAITAALALVVLDFKDARPSLEKVSYSLLIFFCGMFITVDGFNKTGIPSTLWELMEPYAKIDHPLGILVLALVILGLSNLASNVPTVLLLGGRVAASAAEISAADEKKAWLLLAWVSTVAGNLSLLGSAANLIVCEQARRAPHFGYNLSFLKHLKFGVPSTLVITAVGLLLIR
ncbi:unnamed protein product [Linum tenue]|uniref:Citrate transporter-like domain-containing protein n=1 Tax=Linum tenue TaxID=586396 RepID=A0AAV0QQI2_9ROSI|nr:unnamed protein product [Linum tenue]